MVARVALTSSSSAVNASSAGMSDLEFQGQSVGIATSHIVGLRPQAGELGVGSKLSHADEKRERSDTSTKEM